MVLNVLIACEESQTECLEFRLLGHNAYSCDIQPCSGGHPEWHILNDVLSIGTNFVCQDGHHVTVDHWDLVIAHPPCTYLAASSATSMFPNKKLNLHRYELMKSAASFFYSLFNFNCPYVCVENPRPLSLAGLPSPSQVINPFDFGDPFSKRTYLWLRNLPPLIHTLEVPSYKSYHDSCSGSKNRSKSFKGIARAMADQFSNFIIYDRLHYLESR